LPFLEIVVSAALRWVLRNFPIIFFFDKKIKPGLPSGSGRRGFNPFKMQGIISPLTLCAMLSNYFLTALLRYSNPIQAGHAAQPGCPWHRSARPALKTGGRTQDLMRRTG
jgi:hypothetical protein